MSKGTPEAMAWLELLEKNGNLIDPYTKSYMSAKNNYEFNAEYFQSLIDKEGSEFIGHLLIVYLGDQSDDVYSELANIYPLFARKPKGIFHQPAFLFINLVTQNVLCAGIGRKNQLFLYDAETSQDVDSTFSDDYGKAFTALDHLGITSTIVDALERLGGCIYEADNLPSKAEPDQVAGALNKGAAPDGLYYYDGDDEWGYTREEIAELEANYADLIEARAEWIDTIEQYFSKNLGCENLCIHSY